MSVVAITGASGFVGRALTAHLRAGGHEVLRFVRGTPRTADELAWNPGTGAIDRAATRVAAVVHLAGENIAAGRWTARRMRAIADSRGPATQRLACSLADLPHPPTLISASAVGYYGDRGDEPLDERSPAGQGFLADVTTAWERAAEPLRGAGARVVHLRIGLVLGPGGALAKMLPAFRLGLGGRLGSGRQYCSWIALADLCRIAELALQRTDLSGPLLCVAPTPVTNREFTATLGRVLRRPTLLAVPAFALRALFGGLADAALLSSQRATPRRLLELGYAFAHPDLEGALRECN